MTTLLSFLFVLGVLVFVHELGHFLVARWYGVRVITFSLGFGPKIVKYNYGGTEYCISVIPLGGFVKLAGETVEDNRSGAPDEFLAKSKWVRFQVYIAGPIMNLGLAVVLLAVVFSQGISLPAYESAPPVIGRIEPASPAAAAGLRVGDLVLSVNGRQVATWEAFEPEFRIRAGRELEIEVDRTGARETVRVTPAAVTKYEIGELGVSPVIRPLVVQVHTGTPAERAGFRNGDVLLSVAGQRGLDREAIIERIRASGGNPLEFIVEREGREAPVSVIPEGPANAATVGLSIQPHDRMTVVDPSVLQAIRLSAEKNWSDAQQIGRVLQGLFTADTSVRQLTGPVGIAEMSGMAARAGWTSLLTLMAMISLNLGLLNLMPVPVLDGGHIAILAAEGLARRDFSVRVKERILMAGAALVILLMVTVLFNDFARLLR